MTDEERKAKTFREARALMGLLFAALEEDVHPSKVWLVKDRLHRLAADIIGVPNRDIDEWLKVVVKAG